MFFLKSKNSDLIGIYIDINDIAFSSISISGNQVKVNKISGFKTNFNVKDKIIKPLSLNSEFFNEKQEWISKLKDSLKKADISGVGVNVTLSHYFSITRFFVMPMIDRKFWSKSIPIESRKYIPVAFDEISSDFFAYPLPDNKRLAVLFSITQKKTVEFLMEIFKKLSISIESIETIPISFERLLSFLDSKDHSKKSYIHFADAFSYTLFSTNNCPVIFREMSMEDSSGISERKSLDLKGSIAFVKRYVPEQVYSTIVISGDNAQLWQKLAENESGLKAEILDISKILNIKTNAFSYISAVGAALRGKIPYKQDLDISGKVFFERLNKKIQNYIFTIVGIISGFFLLLTIFNYVKIYLISNKVSSLKSSMTDIGEFENLPEDMIKSKAEEMQKKASIMKVLFSDDKDYLAPKLQVIADTIPRDLWVTEISYSNPIGISETSDLNEKTFSIKGETMLKGNKKIAVVDIFLKDIKKATEFKAFWPPKGTIEAVIESGSDKLGYGDIDSANTSTGYSINCVQKKKVNKAL